MLAFKQGAWFSLILIIISPLTILSGQKESTSTKETIERILRDYSPAVVGRVSALGSVGLLGYSQFPTQHIAYVIGLLSALPVYFLSGSAAYWVMKQCGLEMGTWEIAPSKTSIACDTEAWLRLFLQIFHPKNIGQLLPLVALELGYNDNYGVVDEGKLYRSARYDAEKLRLYNKQEKLSCVVNLMNNIWDSSWWQEFCKESHNQKINLVNIELPGLSLYSPEDIERLLAVMHDERNYPMHVNCFHGKDRTGFFCTLYLLEQKGYDVERAIAEQMSYARYGHFECHLPYICAILRKWHEIRSVQSYAKDQESLNDALERYQVWYQDHTRG